MNIAIFSPEFPPITNWGGVSTFSLNLAKLLAQSQHSITVFTIGTNSKVKQKQLRGINVIELPRLSNTKYVKFLLNFFRLKFLVKVLKRYVPHLLFLIQWNIVLACYFIKNNKLSKFDFCHSPVQYCSAFLIKILRPNIILILHAQGPLSALIRYEKITIDLKLCVVLERSYMIWAGNKIVACSRHIETYLVRQLPQLKNRITTIPNFIDNAKYTQGASELDINKLVFFGRLEYRKGPDLVFSAFLDIAEMFPSLQVIFIGYDANCMWKDSDLTFKQWVIRKNIDKSLENRISFVPWISDKQKLLTVLKKNVGIAVLPSRYEPFGFSAVESMAMGMILVTTRNTRSDHLVSNSNCFLARLNSDDISATIKKIHRLSVDQLKKIQSEAKRSVNTYFGFHFAKVLYAKLYDDISSVYYI